MLAPYLLLVEDNQDDVLLTLRMLRNSRCPFIARVVYDGVQALEFLQNAGTLPAAVLLNSNLPRLNGEEVARLLRADKRTQKLPVLLIKGAEDECRQMARSERPLADGCLTKPLSWAALSRALRRLGLVKETDPGLVVESTGQLGKRLF